MLADSSVTRVYMHVYVDALSPLPCYPLTWHMWLQADAGVLDTVEIAEPCSMSQKQQQLLQQQPEDVIAS